MVSFRRPRFRQRSTTADQATAPESTAPGTTDPEATAPGTTGSGSDNALGWAVLGVAIVLGLFLIIPFGVEKSSAVIPASSTGPAPQSSGPQTWVLSSTVAAPGPSTSGAGSGDHLGDADSPTGVSESLIIRLPASSPASPPRATTPTTLTTPTTPTPLTTTMDPTAPSSGVPGTPSTVPTAIPTSGSPCPQPTTTSAAPPLAEDPGDFGSTSGTRDEIGYGCPG